MRRQRFTATLVDGRKIVVLAYTADWVRERYPSATIERGDYRKHARAREITAQLFEGGFKLDQRALDDACALLGLTLPVRVRFHSRVGGTLGNYRLRDGWHDIMVKSYLPAERASRTLWHELTHAMQAERAGGTRVAWSREIRSQKIYSYSIRPSEREANEMARTMADCPLTVPA